MKLGKVAGVYFHINPALLLLCIVYGYLGLIGEVLVIIAALIIHEIAHIISGIMLGIKIAEVELLPFGGQVRIEDFTGIEPEKEIYLALAGPVISFSVALLFYFLYSGSLNKNLHLFININFFLGFFNLFPALPLDGGRVLRAVLSRTVGFKKATRRAAFIGEFIAVGIFACGVYRAYLGFEGFNLIIIGILLFWAARREEKFLAYSFMRFLINKKGELSRSGFLSCRPVVCRPDTPVKNILNDARPVYYMLVVVVDENHRIIGMHTEAELVECLLEKGPGATVMDC
ncbi:MAG: site-2 protease family protein [Syntrophomonadaceae bacterium]|nr:site-2 protease family protein [Syntrophomonadaceae bacterium]